MRNWRTSSIRSSNRAGAMAILTVMMLLLALLSLCLGAEMVNPGKILAELLEGGRDSAAVRIFLYVRLPAPVPACCGRLPGSGRDYYSRRTGQLFGGA